jgi:GTPase
VLPSVVIVGRPNVGKSTLFNLIVGSRRAIVGNEPGITRDRIYGEAGHRGRRFDVVDTGGIVPDDDELIPSEIFRQARAALNQADQIIYVIDGRTEITGTDRELARLLLRMGKPVTLAVNKIDVPAREELAHEFHELGIVDLYPVSAEHRIGIEELLDHVTRDFPIGMGNGEPRQPKIRVAIIGRPNVGKSTLLNVLAGEERVIVTPVPGTTRDAIDESVIRDGIEYVFVDTAGIRRKGKTKLMAEKLSVIMARKHIESADVVLVLIDAGEGVTAIDATIAGYAHEAGRPVVICVNKWDAAENRNKKTYAAELRSGLRYLDYAPIAFLSAKNGAGVAQLFGLIRRGWESANRRVATSELNAFFQTLEADLNLKIKYLTQAGVRPPTFVVFKESARPLHFSYQRYLINRLRERFDFGGAPIVIKAKSKRKSRTRK